MIRLHRPANAPSVLTDQGEVQTRQFCEQFATNPGAYRDGTSTFSFDRNIYGHESVKTELVRVQHDKCCFCEAKVTHISSGDVEHYRPKAGVCQSAGDPLERPGYYWLAYHWENLLFCCELCNRRHKRNLFPLTDPQQRARTHNDSIKQELPLFINPSTEDPSQFISFRDEMPFPIGGNPRGEAAIKALGLDRSELNDDRLQHLKITRSLIYLAMSQPNTPEGKRARQLVEFACSDAGEYAAMVRAELVGNHPDFFS